MRAACAGRRTCGAPCARTGRTSPCRVVRSGRGGGAGGRAGGGCRGWQPGHRGHDAAAWMARGVPHGGPNRAQRPAMRAPARAGPRPGPRSPTCRRAASGVPLSATPTRIRGSRFPPLRARLGGRCSGRRVAGLANPPDRSPGSIGSWKAALALHSPLSPLAINCGQRWRWTADPCDSWPSYHRRTCGTTHPPADSPTRCGDGPRVWAQGGLLAMKRGAAQRGLEDQEGSLDSAIQAKKAKIGAPSPDAGRGPPRRWGVASMRCGGTFECAGHGVCAGCMPGPARGQCHWQRAN
jgi:hypothetical protein